MTLFRRTALSDQVIRVYPFALKNGSLALCSKDAPAIIDALQHRPPSPFFRADAGECQLLKDGRAIPNAPVSLLLGLGEVVDAESLRRSLASLAQFTRSRGIEEISLCLGDFASDDRLIEGARAACEGILLGNYRFETFKEIKKGHSRLKAVHLIEPDETTWNWVMTTKAICDGVMLARDLTNGNAEEITPIYLAQLAMNFAERYPSIKTQIWDAEKMVEEKLGLTLAVARGSHEEPRVIISEYDGGGGPHIALIGKGVTFDTGGLCLKPSSNMTTMKCDMGGAAAVFGILHAIAELKLVCRLTAIIPAVENAIGSRSFKPGDVQRACNGLTVEIDNTDAEGRLILGEMLHIANTRYKPDHMIDLATLTGAVEVCLGTEAAGLLTSDDHLAEQLSQAGQRTFERVWRLPLFEEYRELLKSDIADLKNSGGRAAGTISAGWFLKDFVGAASWAHLDIAGVAYLDKPKRYHLQHGTGFGVRLITDWLMALSNFAH